MCVPLFSSAVRLVYLAPGRLLLLRQVARQSQPPPCLKVAKKLCHLSLPGFQSVQYLAHKLVECRFSGLGARERESAGLG